MKETAKETMKETTGRHSAAYFRVRTTVRVALGVAGLAVLLAAASWADGPLHDEPTMPECATEDAAGPCVWRGDDMGAGR